MSSLISIKFRQRWLCISVFILITVAGCATPDPHTPSLSELERIQPKELIKKQTVVKAPEPVPFVEKMEPITKDVVEETRLYSLLFENAALGDILSALLADTEHNLSIESGVDLSRPITVRMKNVTLQEALDMVVVRGSGYAWNSEGGFLHIKRFEEKIYHFDYLDIGGETNIDTGGDMLAASVEDSGVTGKFQVKALRSAEKSDVWAGVGNALEALKSPDGVLRINRNAGLIYMADTPTRIETMVAFLDQVSESLHRQVFIEAKIMEVKLDDTHKYGIDWSEIELLFTSDLGFLPDNFELFFNSGGRIALADNSSFSTLVDFLRTQGDVSVLSNPHLAVLNGQSAVFTVGFQFPFGDISGVDEDLETNTITFRSSIKRVILGLQLGITPQISSDGIISLLIVPTITRLQENVDVELPTSSGTQTISNPVIDLQELATTVRVREGQSLVLAGLINQVKNMEKEGLPLLNQLPGLKHLFGKIKNTHESSELVILITPFIRNAG